MSQHKPWLLGAVRAYINGTHSAQPAGQLITGQADRLSLVCVYVCANICVHAAGEGTGGMRVGQSIFPQGHPLLAVDLVPIPGWETGTRPSLTSPQSSMGKEGAGKSLFLRLQELRKPEPTLSTQMGLERPKEETES